MASELQGSHGKISTGSVIIRRGTSPSDLEAVVNCFKAYTTWLDEDLTHQNYDAELNGLPGKYAPPAGALFLAVDTATNATLGCIALRAIQLDSTYLQSRPATDRYCELKRLFVYPEARGRQVARMLLLEALGHAKHEGYDEMLLDTLSRMTAAIRLYKAEGFVEVEPYNLSPLEGIKYFGKRLKNDYN